MKTEAVVTNVEAVVTNVEAVVINVEAVVMIVETRQLLRSRVSELSSNLSLHMNRKHTQSNQPRRQVA